MRWEENCVKNLLFRLCTNTCNNTCLLGSVSHFEQCSKRRPADRRLLLDTQPVRANLCSATKGRSVSCLTLLASLYFLMAAIASPSGRSEACLQIFPGHYFSLCILLQGWCSYILHNLLAIILYIANVEHNCEKALLYCRRRIILAISFHRWAAPHWLG